MTSSSVILLVINIKPVKVKVEEAVLHYILQWPVNVKENLNTLLA